MSILNKIRFSLFNKFPRISHLRKMRVKLSEIEQKIDYRTYNLGSSNKPVQDTFHPNKTCRLGELLKGAGGLMFWLSRIYCVGLCRKEILNWK